MLDRGASGCDGHGVPAAPATARLNAAAPRRRRSGASRCGVHAQCARPLAVRPSGARTSAPHPPHINVSINALIPKPHTPMQWAQLVAEEDLRRKHEYLRSELAKMGNSVRFSYTSYQEAFLETLLSRGDRRLARVISHACDMDNVISESNNEGLYALMSECEAAGIDAYGEVHRKREVNTPLPWSHISAGVSKGYLWEEWRKYFSREPSVSCKEACAGCGLSCF